MTTERPKDMSASVKTRLLQISRERREEFQSLLTRYAAQRFLYRLSRSPHRHDFVLKRATLFAHWTGDIHRPTRDLDLLGYGDPQISHIVEVFKTLCEEPVEEDGLDFLPATVKGTTIKDGEEYEGVRITLTAMLGKAKIPLQIDVGFGDVITPTAEKATLPAMLNMPPAELFAYPRETVVAEKCQAMVKLAMANSRLKDFYDLWYLATNFDFDGSMLAEAVAATFERRETSLPSETPIGLTPIYYEDVARQAQWRAFSNKSNLPGSQMPSFTDIVAVLIAFLMPLLTALNSNSSFNLHWDHSTRSWRPTESNGKAEHKAISSANE